VRKKQQRRTVSLTHELYVALERRREVSGEGISTFAERVLRAELGMARAVPAGATERVPRAARVSPAAAQVISRSVDPKIERAKAVALEQSKVPEVVRDNALLENPSRLPTCTRESLHEAHDDRPSIYNSARGPRLTREDRALDEADPYVDHFSSSSS